MFGPLLELAELQKYVEANGLFLAPDLKSLFRKIVPVLHGALVDMEVGKSAEDWKMQGGASGKLAETAKPLHDAFEAAIEHWLRSHAKPSAGASSMVDQRCQPAAYSFRRANPPSIGSTRIVHGKGSAPSHTGSTWYFAP